MKVNKIKNKALELHTTAYGASMVALYFKDRDGIRRNLIYGYTREDRYRGNPFFMGATCGRYAGRIKGHGFELDKTRYDLASDGTVHLHGGSSTLAFKKWELQEIVQGEEPSIKYHITSEHLDGGYPGRLEIEAQYSLKGQSLEICYRATCDRSTYINLTNHNYYNLNGGGSVSDHFLQVAAEGRLAADTLKIPTGEIRSLTGSPYDFTALSPLKETLKKTTIDDVYVLSQNKPQCHLTAPATGIEMKLYTNQPGLVIFVPEQLDEGPFLNKTPNAFPAICLEPQNFPDAPNKQHFPSALLKKGESYEHKTILEFNLVKPF